MRSNDYIWFNGRIVNWDDAQVHVTSETASRGLNVFEGMRAYWRPRENSYAVIAVQEHLERLRQSALALSFPVSNMVSRFRRGISQVLRFVPAPANLYIRPTIYMEQGAYEVKKSQVKLGEYISWRPEASFRFRKIKCRISSWVHVPSSSLPPSAKIGANYTAFRFSRLEAKSFGFDEAILTNIHNHISETAGGSIFIVRNGVVITPPLKDGILPSITRRIVLETLCPLLGIKTKEAHLVTQDLFGADEVFAVGTMDEISQVVMVNQKKFIDLGPDSLVQKLQSSYHSLCFEGKFDDAGWVKLYKFYGN